MQDIVVIKRLRHSAILPAKATIGSIGYDLCSADYVTLQPNELKRVSTGISISDQPKLSAAFIYPRSSLELKWGLRVQLGVVDTDYKDEIFVLVRNLNNYVISISEGWKIAQLIFEPVLMPRIKELYQAVDQFQETSKLRVGGFGSTDPPIDLGVHCSNQLQYYEEGYEKCEGLGIHEPTRITGRQNCLLWSEENDSTDF